MGLSQSPLTDAIDLHDPDSIRQHRPAGWEHLYFFMLVERGVASLAAKRSKFNYPVVVGAGQPIPRSEAPDVADAELDVFHNLGLSIDSALGENLKTAVGPDGEHGDPERLLWCGSQIVAIYEGMLDWAERVRSYIVPFEFTEAFRILAEVPQASLQAYDTWIGDCSVHMEEIRRMSTDPSHPGTVSGEAVLKLEIDKQWTKRYNKALRKAIRGG